MAFNIQRQRRKWPRAVAEQKYHTLCPEKIERIEGKMFWTDERRLNMLALTAAGESLRIVKGKGR